MATDLTTIEAKIVIALKTVTELQQVFDYEPLSIDILPAATIFYTGFNQKDSAMPNNQEVSHNWALRLYIQLQDAEKAQKDIKALIPKVMAAIKSDRRFAGTCLYNEITNGTVGVFMDKQNPQLIAELSLSAIVMER